MPQMIDARNDTVTRPTPAMLEPSAHAEVGEAGFGDDETDNRGGGCCWDLSEIERIRAVCKEHDIAMHLDGARLFNAVVARNQAPRDYGRLFETISICLPKGLGAPAGSLLLGSRALISRAHRQRKLLGGGMRQAGYLAAAGLFALEHNVQRLQEDHRKAKALQAELH